MADKRAWGDREQGSIRTCQSIVARAIDYDSTLYGGQKRVYCQQTYFLSVKCYKLGDYPYGYTVYTRVQMNTQGMPFEGTVRTPPVVSGNGYVPKPRVWNHNTEAVSFESWPPFKVQGSGRNAILATSIQPGTHIVPVPCL